MQTSLNLLHWLLGSLLFVGSMSAFTSDFWAQPTPLPPEVVRLADTWSDASR